MGKERLVSSWSDRILLALKNPSNPMSWTAEAASAAKMLVEKGQARLGRVVGAAGGLLGLQWNKLRDVGVGVEDKQTAGEHVRSKVVHDRFGLKMDITKHLVRTPMAQEPN